ncbi:replication protein A 14 kDa subunit [Blastocystis sp. ATCC 50177/Nand II]|uniref:Replication protein A 14 kDa subunit n=1 Tax=Blastocystis sp. subtype 1 (strain ATCC 50177 / NandII) TaxID=478820 RepID=A0A196SDS7_BLAHN|nr:replication protein A 14 kDa subunit [Blastocystis sp. ATCC 50177/Nand II]
MENQFTAPILPETPIARVNGALVNRFVGAMVSIVGTVEGVYGDRTTIRSSDNMSIAINTPSGFQYPQGKVVEVIGTVENNGSITLQYATGFDGDYNAAGYNKLVEYMNGKFHGEVF